MSVEEVTPFKQLHCYPWLKLQRWLDEHQWRTREKMSTYFTLQILSIWKLSYLNEQTSCCAIDNWQERGANLHACKRLRKEQDRASFTEEPMTSQWWAPESQKYKILLFAQKILKICILLLFIIILPIITNELSNRKETVSSDERSDES